MGGKWGLGLLCYGKEFQARINTAKIFTSANKHEKIITDGIWNFIYSTANIS